MPVAITEASERFATLADSLAAPRRADDSPLGKPAEPPSPPDELDDPSDLEEIDLPSTGDDARWDAFIPDDDERDPLPEPGDFWIDFDASARCRRTGHFSDQ